MRFNRAAVGIALGLVTALVLVGMVGQAVEAEPEGLGVKGYIRPAICTDYLGFSSHCWPVEVRLLEREVPLQVVEARADESGLINLALDKMPTGDHLRVEIIVKGDWAYSSYQAEMAVEGPELDFGRIYMQKRF